MSEGAGTARLTIRFGSFQLEHLPSCEIVSVYVLLFLSSCLSVGVRAFGSDSQNIADVVHLSLQQLLGCLREQGGRRPRCNFLPIILLMQVPSTNAGLYGKRKFPAVFCGHTCAAPLRGTMVYYLVIPLAPGFLLQHFHFGGDRPLRSSRFPEYFEDAVDLCLWSVRASRCSSADGCVSLKKRNTLPSLPP